MNHMHTAFLPRSFLKRGYALDIPLKLPWSRCSPRSIVKTPSKEESAEARAAAISTYRGDIRFTGESREGEGRLHSDTAFVVVEVAVIEDDAVKAIVVAI